MIPPPIFPSLVPKPIKPVVEEPIQFQGEDYFDQLPDPMVGIILNKLKDAQSLCRCLLVSKRFASIVPQVDSVSVVAKPSLSVLPNNNNNNNNNNKKSISRSFLKSLFSKLVKSPKKSGPNSIGPAELSHWISDSVKNFPEIRHLRVQLPDNGGIVGFPDTTGGLLKWTAQFGNHLHRCAIIGATSLEKSSSSSSSSSNTDSKPDLNSNQNLLTDEELRSRVVWVLSCLVAACARHGVAKKTMMENADLRSAVIVDGCKQGRLTMDEKQIKELRESTKTDDSDSDSDPIWKRTTVPNVIVKLWYAPELVLPESGYVMKGATVVAIRPDTGKPEEPASVEREYELLRSGFGGEEADLEQGLIAEAVKEIVKSKWKLIYKLQMNSF